MQVEIKRLTRKTSVKFAVYPMVRKLMTQVQDRASFINMLTGSGVSYQHAVREYDRRHSLKK